MLNELHVYSAFIFVEKEKQFIPLCSMGFSVMLKDTSAC